MRKTPFALLALATLLTGAAPTALAGPTDDFDGDRLPDETEAIACSSAASRLVINTAGQGRVRCEGDVEYDVVVVVTAVAPVLGPDADNDGFPATVSLQTQQWTIDPKDPDFVEAQATGTTSINVDPNDANEDVPVLATQALPVPLVTRGELRGDCDGDFLPDALWLYHEQFTFDRRQAPPLVSNGGEWRFERNVDPETCVPATAVVQPTIDLALNLTRFAVDVVLTAYGNFDRDDDLVPDVTEPTLCFVQFPPLAQDGSCVGDDYTPPPADALVPPLPPGPGDVVGQAVEEVDEIKGFLLEGECYRSPLPNGRYICWE